MGGGVNGCQDNYTYALTQTHPHTQVLAIEQMEIKKYLCVFVWGGRVGVESTPQEDLFHDPSKAGGVMGGGQTLGLPSPT